MVICQCARVSERAIHKAVRRGAVTVNSVAQETGAGRACGCCVSALKRLIEQELGPNRMEDSSHAAA